MAITTVMNVVLHQVDFSTHPCQVVVPLAAGGHRGGAGAPISVPWPSAYVCRVKTARHKNKIILTFIFTKTNVFKVGQNSRQ
jgi:hypothetical protein